MRKNLKNESGSSIEELLENALQTAESDEAKYNIREALQKLKTYQ